MTALLPRDVVVDIVICAPEAFVVAIADVRRIVLGVKPLAARGQAGWSKKMQPARSGRARRFGATSGSGRVQQNELFGPQAPDANEFIRGMVSPRLRWDRGGRPAAPDRTRKTRLLPQTLGPPAIRWTARPAGAIRPFGIWHRTPRGRR